MRVVCVRARRRAWLAAGRRRGGDDDRRIAFGLRPRAAPELKLVMLALAMGALWDSALVSSGWIVFTSGMLIDGVAPPWILALWALFATTLNASLGWLKNKLLVAALFGALGGPLSYWAGMRLGALQFAAPMAALIALSIGWGVMTPLLIMAARRFDRLHTTR
jgi:hypothetical protein